MTKKNWEPKKLNELGFVGRGRSRHRPRNEPSLYGGDYPFFQTGDIKAAELYLRNYSQTYNEKGLAQSKLWESGTLCITIAANIAETSILAIEGCFPDSVVGFIANPEQADVRFVKYYLDTIKMQMQSISKGTTQDNLSLDKLLSFDILTPPLPNQRKIAVILSAYDNLIENNTRRIQILEEMAQTIYREWFVHYHFPGHENVRMVDSGTDLGEVPEEWEVGSYTDYIDVLSGGTPKTKVSEYWNGNIPWFTPKDLGKSFFVLDTERKITELGLSKCNSKLYPANTVFITARGTVGRCVLPAIPMAMSQTNYALLGYEITSQNYIYLMTLDKVDILKKQATGAVFDTIIVDTFKKLNIFVPDKSIIEEFDKVVSPIFELIKTLIAINAKLQFSRDLLLPKLVSGQIDVGELDIDVGID